MAKKQRRLAIITDGETWWVRRIAYTVRDNIKNKMIYHCDKPIGRSFDTANAAMRKAKDAISNPRSGAWR